MSYYNDVYLKRLNRYGLDYQSRLKGARERNFENYLLSTPFRVNFEYEEENHPGSLERMKQTYTRIQCYLLTRDNLELPNGTVLDIEDIDGNKEKWMIWYLEQIENGGYNRYIVLKMTHELTWTARDGTVITQLGYFHGPGTTVVNDSVKSSEKKTVYPENNNVHMFITNYNPQLALHDYVECISEGIKQAYIVKAIDVHSTPGVQYNSVDPVAVRDLTTPETNATSSFWLNGGM